MAFVKCPTCNKNISDRASKCPFCKTPFVKPVAPPEQNTPAAVHGDTQVCPYCAETIKQEAIRCRFCGADLVAPTTAKGGMGTLGVFLHVMPWAGIFLVLFIPFGIWLAPPLLVLGGAILIAVDASQNGIGSRPDPITDKKEGGPVIWFIGTLLLWLVIYPLYMFRRARYGAKSSGVACLIGALLFFGAGIYQTWAFANAMDSAQIESEREQAHIERQARQEYERLMREVQKSYK